MTDQWIPSSLPDLADVAPGMVPADGDLLTRKNGKWDTAPSGSIPASKGYTYVPSTGVAATDTAALQAVINALPSTGGAIAIDFGPYALASGGITTNGRPVRLIGLGSSEANITPNVNHYYAVGSRFTYAFATGSAITIDADGCDFERLFLENTSGTTPTSGAGILISSQGNSTKICNNAVKGFYVDIDVRAGTNLHIEDNMLVDPVLDGLSIASAVADSGGHTIQGNWISAGPTNLTPHAGINWTGGSGDRIENNRIGGEDTGMFTYGIRAVLSGSASATIFEILGNTIEDLTTAVSIQSTGTGVIKKVNIVGNYIDTKAGGSANAIELIGADATHQILYGEIDGNLINAHGNSIYLQNAQRIRVGVNEYAASNNGFAWSGTNSFCWMGPNMDFSTAGAPPASMFRVGAYYYDTDLKKTLFSDGTSWRDASGALAAFGGPTPAVLGALDVQVFRQSGTWNKPAGAKYVMVVVAGPGGGGGGGVVGAASISGGGGGGAGAFGGYYFEAADLPSQVAVVVGTGGAGGAGVSTGTGTGNAGAAGSASTTFGTYLAASPGLGGSAGSNANSTGGAGGTWTNTYPSGAHATGRSATGGAGGGGTAATGAPGAGSAGGTGGGSGGGSGGGVTAGGAGNSGGSSATVSVANGTAAGGGSSAVNPPERGGTSVNLYLPGFQAGAGGGGGANLAADATLPARGGLGGFPGGGGGGGASTKSGTASDGGAGGDGLVMVVSW